MVVNRIKLVKITEVIWEKKKKKKKEYGVRRRGVLGIGKSERC